MNPVCGGGVGGGRTEAASSRVPHARCQIYAREHEGAEVSECVRI
jgi:hypothetical protein